jgi:cytochrome oxidase Cu insertion factor (SCO1/SenC/PrrC family)
MPDIDQEELVVDIPSSGQSIDVEVEPLELDPERSDDEDSEEEHLEYSKKVKRRIDKLTKKTREMERQQQAAVEYARGVQAENNQLRTRVQDLDQGYVAEYGDRIATQADSLSRDLETAIATNDTSAQVDLNKKIAQLAIEEERVRTAKQQQAQSAQAAQYQQQQQQQQQQAQYQQQQQVPVRADPKAMTWAENNSWFGEDDAMTFAAFGIHKTLVEVEGFDTESPEYYDEIDKRIKVAFPHKFNGSHPSTEVRRPQQAVASATRSGSAGRRTVRLSSSEVAIAKKLGVPLDQYAKYKR